MVEIPDLGAHLREEDLSDATTLLLRGGPDSVEKLRAHAARTARAYSYEGAPASGVSMFAVLDDVGPASRAAILGGKLASYRTVHEVNLSALRAGSFRALPTFARPHITILIPPDRVAELLSLLGPGAFNPHYGQVKRPERRRLT